MEVLPCSNTHYSGESDCLQQGPGTTFVYDRESSCIDHGEVQVTGAKMDNLVLNEEESQFGQGIGQSTVDEFPTPGDCNIDSHFDSDVDGQNLSGHLQDSEDAEDQCTGGSLASEDCRVAIDPIGNGFPSSLSEGTPLLPEHNWPDEDEPMPVWVKWRGMWQAGIRCARSDWPLSTLKAKPTHQRKKYTVVFFPRTKNYSWADVHLLLPINEFPEPIPYRTHKAGTKMVKDLTLAHRFIMQKLVIGIINIVDQLHSEALIENARNVAVWKEFAMEASRCKDYSDTGRLLLKLQNMILQCYVNSYWLQHSLQSWIKRCQNAGSAEFVELLKEELVNSLTWNKVQSLLHGGTQTTFNTEWKTWKQEVIRSFSMSHPIVNSGNMDQQCNYSPSPMELQTSSKRPKLVVRRAEAHNLQVETQCSQPPINAEIDSEFFDAATSEIKLSRAEASLEGAVQSDSPGNEVDKWGGIVIEAVTPEVVQARDLAITPVNGGDAYSFGSGSKSRQCAAIVESKGRQCVRWANEGDVYCCVHLQSRFVGNSAKVQTSTFIPQMCEGTTVLGTKCKHRALFGTSFCKKHRPRSDQGLVLSSPDNKLKRKYEENIQRSETTSCKDIVLFGEAESPPLQVDPIAVMHRESFSDRSLNMMSEQFMKKDNSTETQHCIGSCSPEASDPCPESPKRHSLYCEKHLPSWLKRARNGKSRIISKEVFTNLLRNCYSREQKLHLHQACELFYRFFKSILSRRNPVPKEIQLQWAISEASKNASVGQFLMRLVFSEKERLEKLWSFTTDKETQKVSFVKESFEIPVDNNGDHDNEGTIKCKICSQNFLDDKSLGQHWMKTHRKEAQWLFRGYACAICLDDFTNKKVLKSHVQERHNAKFVDQCMLLQCIPCGGHFANIEQLWSHVLSAHPSTFSLPTAQQDNLISFGDGSSQTPEPGKAGVDNINCDNQGGLRKFICKICGFKFDLLPDLGRHHQAAHMGANPVAPRLPKRGNRFYAYKLKSGRVNRSRLRKSLGAASYKIRNRVGASMKKSIQLASSISSEQLKLQSHVVEADGLGKLTESQSSAIATILFSEVKKTKPRPSNFEILSLARSACCKVSLQASLEEKYGILPERMYLKAAKLCSEQNILVDWHHEGFTCPKGCKRIIDQPQVSPLLPRSDVVRPISSFSPDAMNVEWEMDECHHVVGSRHFTQEPIVRTIILCDDISFGEESVPIACVVDENLLGSLPVLVDGPDSLTTSYSMPWEGFTYVMKPLLYQYLDVEAESLQLGCTCAHSMCSSGTCDHVYLFNNDYEDAKDIYGKPMNGRFPYDENGRIILEEGYLVYECNQKCSCSKTCQNRVLQNGVRVKLEVFKTEKKGWAVRAVESIPRGTFVCEYIGEVINEQEATKRRNRYGGEACSYLYEIDAHSNDMSRLIEEQVPYVIDATNYGNVSRYINHSCSPNLINHQVLVESMDCQLAHIGLYAGRDITIGEELTYDYHYKLVPGEGCPCLCGAPNCKGRLY